MAIPLLGQVNDLLGVAEAGFQSEQLNSFVNVKTADKDLQFGADKCTFMVVSKMKQKYIHETELFVDSWKLKHLPDGSFEEEFLGKVPMSEEKTFMYLGHMLSNDGSNMPNIIHKKNKTIGTKKQIIELVKPLGLYTFESAVVYVESLLRSSILYASETMTNMRESEYRELEKIEETVVQKVLKTSRSCSRHLSYLETGIVPARFQVQRQVLNFLQYIIQQPPESLLYKVYKALENHPTKKDWLCGAKHCLETFEIKMTLEEIKSMKAIKYKHIVKLQAQKAALKYLLDKQTSGKKGKCISYKQIQMADYLSPECHLSVEEKTELFSFRSEMNNLPNNFGKSELCEFSCPEEMTNEHLLNCVYLNQGRNIKLDIEQLRNRNIKEKNDVFKVLQDNTRKRINFLISKS